MPVAPLRRGAVLLPLIFLGLGLLARPSTAQTENQQRAAGQFASDKIDSAALGKYADEAVQLEREYLRINTSNPPGNELATAQWFKQIFDREGIENQILEYSPGRANIIARLRNSGSQPPLILLNHMDVVTSDPSRWKYPPFAAEQAD